MDLVLHPYRFLDQYQRFGDWDENIWKSVGWEPMALQLLIEEGRHIWIGYLDKQPVNPYTASLWGLHMMETESVGNGSDGW